MNCGEVDSFRGPLVASHHTGEACSRFGVATVFPLACCEDFTTSDSTMYRVQRACRKRSDLNMPSETLRAVPESSHAITGHWRTSSPGELPRQLVLRHVQHRWAAMTARSRLLRPLKLPDKLSHLAERKRLASAD